jgi:phosphoglycolate phosphatase-like HAD superfamily hydrolase
MKNIKVIAFDCDGVMFDTKKANQAYYNRILNHFGKPSMTPEQFAYAHMHTVDEALAFLFGDFKILNDVQAYRKKVSYLPFIKDMEIEPNLKPLLQKLRPTYKTAIATNRTDTMNSVLDGHGLKNSFDLVITALDVERPKPHPDPLIKILDYFKLAPRHAIYVGDSKLDEMAATAAGVPLVAYNNISLSAAYYIKNLHELEQILDV